MLSNRNASAFCLAIFFQIAFCTQHDFERISNYLSHNIIVCLLLAFICLRYFLCLRLWFLCVCCVAHDSPRSDCYFVKLLIFAVDLCKFSFNEAHTFAFNFSFQRHNRNLTPPYGVNEFGCSLFVLKNKLWFVASELGHKIVSFWIKMLFIFTHLRK